MKTLTTVIMISLSTSSFASSYDSKIQALYSPQLVDSIIKDQKAKHTNSDVSIYSKHQNIQTIDGPEDAIEISSSRTSLPEQYVYPTSKEKMERYAGR